jgi:hypothetical protein
VAAHGPTKRIIFSNSREVPEFIPFRDHTSIQLSLDSEHESVPPPPPPKPIKLNVALFGVGLSVIDEMPEELMYLTLSSLEFTYRTSSAEESVEVKIARMQIDNQIYNTPFPIVLHSNIPTPRTPDEAPDLFMHFCAVKSKRKVRNKSYFNNYLFIFFVFLIFFIILYFSIFIFFSNSISPLILIHIRIIKILTFIHTSVSNYVL